MTAVVTPGAGDHRVAPARDRGPKPHRSAHTSTRACPDRSGRTLELEVVAGGDPARLARMLAAMVNNSPMALAEVRVGDHSAYPVPDRTVVTRRGPLHLTLRMRDSARRLDALVVEEVVALVSGLCRVVRADRP